jgi:drug/metabolite transporter (DMT)-like permease
MNESSAAALRLLLATAAWGMSFATAKAIMLCQESLIPGLPAWFHAAFVLFNRMAISALLMQLIWRPFGPALCRSELVQGIELGLFGAFGMLLQTDAQNLIPASSSAFFTQFTCVFVPLVVAFRFRSWPSLRVIAACILVLAGCFLLNGPAPGTLGLGFGEIETILGAALFTGQILAIERDRYADNNMRRVASVMFAVKALVLLPVMCVGVFAHHPSPRWIATVHGVFLAYVHAPLLGMTMLITVISTLYAYLAMTRWQGSVSSTQAGLIYATEPVFATLWALFLPEWFSWFSGISYSNEVLSAGFFKGAALVLAANALLLFRPYSSPGLKPTSSLDHGR